MSWHCSRAQVAEFLEASCSDGELCAPLNTTPMPDQFYWPDKTTEHSRLSRFGMTCVPLTADRGAALLTWFLADSRAKTSAQPGRATGSTGSEVGSGRKWLGLLARFDRDSLSWRTPQCSLVEGLDVFSETWPRWGSMRDGVCWAQSTPVRLTNASGCGSELTYPTPTTVDGGSMFNKSASSGAALRPTLGAMARFAMWPTPRTTGLDGGSGERFPNPESVVAVREGEASVGGSLNPTWVEWLMGWPLGWTDLRPLGTDKFRQWQNSHGRH